MEMMEVDEPLSSLEAQRAPALDTEEGLLIPVAFFQQMMTPIEDHDVNDYRGYHYQVNISRPIRCHVWSLW